MLCPKVIIERQQQHILFIISYAHLLTVIYQDVCELGSTPGCGRSNLGSIPAILPNIVRKVKILGQTVDPPEPWQQKEF